ncbi:MAG: lipopolysaccharide biosynthesis protein [Candidatus Aminicenantes bacterium]|nr:lipopolysaccharide biosynthesis protein [Candidatus Aminicenantes bacterium]
MNKKSKSLTNIILIYAMGTLSSRVIGFVLVFVITFFLTRKELGTYDIVITTVALVAPFIYLQLTDAILRWMLHENMDGAITTKLFTNVCAILFVSILVFSPVYWIVASFIDIPLKPFVFFVLIAQSVLPLLQLFVRGSGKNILFALSGVVFSVLYTALTMLFLIFYKFKVEGLLIANATAAIGTALFLFVKGKYYRKFSVKFLDIQFGKTLIFYSLPLLPNALAWWLYTSANRYVVLHFLGLEYSGIWAISYKIPTILAMVNHLFFMAWQEKSLREYNSPNRDKYYTEVLAAYASLLLGLILVLVAATKPILHHIVQRSFFISWRYSMFLLLAFFFQDLALFYGMGYFCAKETKRVLYTTLIGSISLIVFSIMLVPFFGLYGAGLATMLGFLAMFLVRLRQTKKYFTIKYPLAITITMLVCIAICYAISYSNSILVQILNNTAALSIAIYINRNFVISKLAQLKRLFRTKFRAA